MASEEKCEAEMLTEGQLRKVTVLVNHGSSSPGGTLTIYWWGCAFGTLKKEVKKRGIGLLGNRHNPKKE